MNECEPDRRAFVKSVTLGMPLLAHSLGSVAEPARPVEPARRGPLKISCNLYSFNEPLTRKSMTLDDVLTFCSDVGFDAVDPTGYYFPGYPAVPPDSYIYALKRKAFRLGLDISGTGVRNDFSLADAIHRREEIALVKAWIDVAAKLDAPILRIFSGLRVQPELMREEVTEYMLEAIDECVAYGAQRGVMLGLQNHADFIETADHMLELLNRINSDWFAANLDIGSFRTGDPYAQIVQVAPQAATWQIKEKLFVNGKETETDLSRIMQIVRQSGYRGYLPIETLGKGDPRQKVPLFYEKVRTALLAS
ncbi:TIM barrel protein [Rudanella paleaurantiibacter]|uniref:TIM barrel protein n=1 Tax=Rudanella paleaurantiibacter TaxID=2614655 RepID=A0A7J5U4S2_9BACT|nr:sugar phosphate isomerase/epimerase family protein [Rudanella paleaurantiibacter]KAB7732577.1 TIM barrel protein [Rudanella paleaurantiibacter]